MTCGLRPSIARADFKRRARVCPGSKCDIPVGYRRTCNQTLKRGVRAAICSRSHNNASFIGEGWTTRRGSLGGWGFVISADGGDSWSWRCAGGKMFAPTNLDALPAKLAAAKAARSRRDRDGEEPAISRSPLPFAAPEPPSCARVATSARQRPTLGHTGEM